MKKSKEKAKKSKVQEKVLLTVLLLLAILVIGLLFTVINLKNQDNKKAKVTIPILKSDMQSELSIDLSSLSSNEEIDYVFKIVNYKDSEINNKQVKYDLNITPSENAEIKLYKNNSKKDLLESNTYKLTNNSLSKNKKEEDEYHLIIKLINTPKKHDRITIKISS